MKSRVYFADLRTTHTKNLTSKIRTLLESVKLTDKIKDKALTAIKLHFGEAGNTAYIRPVFIREIVDAVREAGGNPFLTDANTLYVGTRSDSVGHLTTAIKNGFDYAVVGAPLIIADGLRGGSETAITVNLNRYKKVFVGSEIVRADAIVSAAHFKGHELSGFGGTIKNLGMGCASRKGKLAQHSSVSPKVKRKNCEGCGECIDRCAQQAITFVDEKAKIDQKKCVGCGECILICPNGAIKIQWNQQIPVFLENMVEYTIGVLKGKKESAAFLNFITDVSPACDCYGYNDAPIVADIGIVASNDPVAIDQASADLVNQAQGRKDSALSENLEPGKDKFRGLYPNVDWEIQLDYAARLGLGTREYELIKI
ncbi:MAG: 4Fe-4S ferredoxin [Desulfobacterales bacterium S7086C20]|nr:MAG: 4Fe-4S ferredoxin [Desulfobacterales bacterium S7086C20]